jgi:hypothetical protein
LEPLPLNILHDLLDHSDTKTTEIYLQAVGDEKRELLMQACDTGSGSKKCCRLVYWSFY